MRQLWIGLLLACIAFGVSAQQVKPFEPKFQGTVTISCGTSSAATAVTVSTLTDQQLEIQNGGTANVFVEIGSADSVAAVVASGYPVLPGMSKVITVGPRITHVACISASGTQSVFVTVGKGQ